jgi:Flp pilus assembly protein TadG
MLGRVRKSETGAEIAEAAFVLPLVFMFLFGMVWFGRAFNIYTTITSAAREGARTAARATCTTCAVPACTWPGTNLPCDQEVENAVLAVLQTSRVDKSHIQTYVPTSLATPTFCSAPAPPGSCTAGPTTAITICRSVLLNPAALTTYDDCERVRMRHNRSDWHYSHWGRGLSGACAPDPPVAPEI